MIKAFIVMLGFVFYSPVYAVTFNDCASHLKKGKEVYQINCLTCHGEKGEGNGPAGQYLKPKPRSFKLIKEYKKGSKVNQIFETVTKGLEGTMMVSFAHIPEPDRKALSCYVYETWVKPELKKAK